MKDRYDFSNGVRGPVIPTARKVMRGWRYFQCSDCGKYWKETCRDHATPSRSTCPTPDCDSHITGGDSPYRSVADETIKTDGFGNLADDAYEKVWLTPEQITQEEKDRIAHEKDYHQRRK